MSANLCLLQGLICYSVTDYDTQHLGVDNPSHVYITVALAHLKHRVSFAHAAEKSPRPGIIPTFKCLVCSAHHPTDTDYFQHIRNNLKLSFELYLKNVNIWINIYNTFLKYKSEDINPIL